VCNREAPDVEQFARQHTDQFQVVGFGTQDSFDEAQDFRAEHGITFPLLWDGSFVSWQELGITGQPAAILYAADGTEMKRWPTMYDEGEVLDAVG
jgi:peroxiredoxin